MFIPSIDKQSLKSLLSEYWIAILQRRSLLRAYQNLYISRNVVVGKDVFDLGAKSQDSPYSHILRKQGAYPILVDNNNNTNTIAIDLESSFSLETRCDTIIAFNILEHIFNHEQFMESVMSCLVKGGCAYIITPFYHPFHPDPNDYYRFSHSYFHDLSFSKRFENVSVERIGKGRLNAVIATLVYRNNILMHPVFYIFIALVSRLVDSLSSNSQFYIGVCVKMESRK